MTGQQPSSTSPQRSPAGVRVGLSRVAVRLPQLLEPVEDILARAGRDAMEVKMFTRVHGLRTSPTLAATERTEDLLVAAGRAALAGEQVSIVLYGHTILTQEFALRGGFATRLRERLGVPDARCYGLSHINCTSVLRGIDYAGRYLRRPDARPDDRVLVLGGDHGSVNDRHRVIPGITLGGDATIGVLVHAHTPARPARYRVLAGATDRDVRFHRNMRMSAEESAAFSDACGEGTVRVLRRAAAAARLRTDELTWVLPQLNNRMFWGKVARAAGIPKDRLCLELIAERGHNFGADALMALEHADRAGRLRPGDRCALVSVAQGAYFQALIVQVEEDS